MSLKALTRKIITCIRDDFNLNSAEARQFFRSQWELTSEKSEDNVSLKYLIYRGVYMIILVSCITFSTTCQSHLFHLFLTNWSFTSQNLYAVLFFTSVFWRWWTISKKNTNAAKNKNTNLELGLGNVDNLLETDHKDKHKNKNKCGGGSSDGNYDTMTSTDQSGPQEVVVENSGFEENRSEISNLTLTYLEKCIWLLINVTNVLPYIVVLGYWLVVYKYDPDQPACEKFRSHYIVHGATAFLALLDALIIAIPVRRTHFLIPTGMVLLYVVFTFLHEAAGGPYRPGKTYIYSVLDWKESPKKALIFSTIGVLVMPLAHFIFCWGIYKLRTWAVFIYNKIKS